MPRRYCPEKKRRSNLWLRYRVTPEEYDALHAQCSGKCQICGARHKQLCVDHCHATQSVRGLLCNECNRAIGMLGDSEQSLRKAWEYLNEHERSSLGHPAGRQRNAVALQKDGSRGCQPKGSRDVCSPAASGPSRNRPHADARAIQQRATKPNAPRSRPKNDRNRKEGGR